MALINMKMSKEEIKESEPTIQKPKEPRYPWGLELSLNDESLDKLDMEAIDFKVGDVVGIRAKGNVTRLSSNQSENGESRESIDIQITDLDIVSENAFDKAFKEATKEE